MRLPFLRLVYAAWLLASVLPAAAVTIPAETDHVKTLDGTWRFKLVHTGNPNAKSNGGGSANAAPQPDPDQSFQEPDYKEGKGWSKLAVPSNWEMAGMSPATFNRPDDTVGLYRLRFDVPKKWKGRCVRLAFDGIQNGAEIWLNGKPVAVDEPSWGRENYHESGWTAFQVHLTPEVKFGEKNVVALRVTKKTRSYNLDAGDYFFLGGIYRPVTLFSVPKTHLADVTVRTRLLAGDLAEVKVLVAVAGNDDARVSMQLAGVGGEVTEKVVDGSVELTKIVKQPRLWSAEFPNLYGLTVKLKDSEGHTTEATSQRIGIREVTIKNGVLLVNGVPVKLAGVCRQDCSPTEGTAVGPALWRKDITMMKDANINAIRTSHYPYGAGFYDLCDELGMYVVDELPYCWCRTDEPEMEPAFVQRARETVRRDKNHPSVIIWTIGNEIHAGRNLQVVADLVKELDPTLPRAVSCFDADKYKVELSDSHYTIADKIDQAGIKARETGHPHIYLENPNTWDIRLAADAGTWVFWSTLLERIWNVCTKYDTIPGTFLFEWADRAVTDPNSDESYQQGHKNGVQLLNYFPETGIRLLKMKGLVDGFRNPRPSLYEVKMIFSPVQVGDAPVISADGVSFPVENRFSFTDLSQLKLSWTLEQSGKAIASGDEQAKLAPLNSGNAHISLPASALAEADTLQVEFIRPDGGSIVAHRFVLKKNTPISQMNSALPAGLPIPQFNLVTRTLHRLPQYWLESLRFPAHLANVVTEPANVAMLAQLKDLSADVLDAKNGQVSGHLHARFADGRFSYRLEWAGDEADVQVFGWTFRMPKSCDHFSWDRAARWTVYPSHGIGRAAGTATPDSMNVSFTRMDRPDAFDFNSTKYDCNWASLTTAAGDGLRLGFQPEQRFHCRAGTVDGGEGFALFVNQHVSPPDDVSKGVIPELYMKLKAGDVVEGGFLVGSNPLVTGH